MKKNTTQIIAFILALTLCGSIILGALSIIIYQLL